MKSITFHLDPRKINYLEDTCGFSLRKYKKLLGGEWVLSEDDGATWTRQGVNTLWIERSIEENSTPYVDARVVYENRAQLEQWIRGYSNRKARALLGLDRLLDMTLTAGDKITVKTDGEIFIIQKNQWRTDIHRSRRGNIPFVWRAEHRIRSRTTVIEAVYSEGVLKKHLFRAKHNCGANQQWKYATEVAQGDVFFQKIDPGFTQMNPTGTSAYEIVSISNNFMTVKLLPALPDYVAATYGGLTKLLY